MFDARTYSPLPTAIAGGTMARVGGCLIDIGPLPMARRTVPFTIHRGVLR